MSQQYIGEVRLFPYNFAPKNWAYCAGQQMSIQQNQALFALLGTTYGGNGVSTFALPDLRGRAIVGTGNGNGGQYIEGQMAGLENVTLIQSQLPIHNHLWNATSAAGASVPPGGNHYGAGRTQGKPSALYGDPGTMVQLAPTTIGMTGGSQPHDNMQPYTVLSYCIALYGIFPSRN
jgi:microcystin-dependent protein